MSLIRHPALLPAALAIALLPVHVVAADAPEHDHTHGQKPAETTSASAVDTPSSAKSGDLMKRMSDLHQRMMAAKTPAERQRLMVEGRKLMQEGMSMMQDMKSGQSMGMAMMGGGMNQGGQASGGSMDMDMSQCMEMHKAMGERVDMMQMMMQAMLDQQSSGAAPAAKK